MTEYNHRSPEVLIHHHHIFAKPRHLRIRARVRVRVRVRVNARMRVGREAVLTGKEELY